MSLSVQEQGYGMSRCGAARQRSLQQSRARYRRELWEHPDEDTVEQEDGKAESR